MRKLIPLICILLGSSVGVAAGIFLKPEPSEKSEVSEEIEADDKAIAEGKDEKDGIEPMSSSDVEYVDLSNQFVVPIVQDDRISSMVVAAFSLEVATGYREDILEKEPKLRNEFLRVMFDHANVGGFSGDFTNVRNIDALQTALREVAQAIAGADILSDVLISEIARQDY